MFRIRHVRECSSKGECWNAECKFKHPRGWAPCRVTCMDTHCKRLHPPGRKVPKKDYEIMCRSELTCWKAECPFKHPVNWLACPLGEYCSELKCESNHPPTRFLCRHLENCLSFECRAIHPLTRVQKCDDGQACTVFHCWGLHPIERVRPCRYAAECQSLQCVFLHPLHRVLQRSFDNGTLNPSAKEFHPSLNVLNVKATEFIPIQKNEGKHNENVCGICYDDLHTDIIQCSSSNRHSFCEGCFVDQVKNQIEDENVGRFIQSKRRISCSLCLPATVVFDDTVVAARAGSVIFALYRKANETAIEVEVCRREGERNRKAIAEMRDAAASVSQQHRLYIAENILTLSCPRCKVPFIDFEGCFAVGCNACNCQFCAWCLKDCGKDAHPHVKECLKSLAPGGYFGQLGQFNSVHLQRRKELVVEYLDKLSPADRVATKTAIVNDLRDLGIQI